MTVELNSNLSFSLTRLDSGPPWYDSAQPDGGSGGGSGGSAVLAYSAPDGLADGNELVVTTDGSGGWDFGVAPSKQAVLGFGQGQLYTSSIGSTLSAHTDPLSGESWSVETPGTREILEVAGIRSLRIDDGDNNEYGNIAAGFIGWDYGQDLPENERVLVSRLTRLKADSLNDDETLPTQWKEMRLSNRFGLGDNGDNYLGKNDYNDDPTLHSTTGQIRTDTAPSTLYGGVGPGAGDVWQRLDNYLDMGALDTPDGSWTGASITPSTEQVTLDANYTNSSGDDSRNMTMHTSTIRTRWILFQGYFTYATGVEISQSDFLIQTGNFARFELANTNDPDTATERYILPFKQWGTGECTLHLWKSLMSGYVGNYVHFYDQSGTFRSAVEIV